MDSGEMWSRSIRSLFGVIHGIEIGYGTYGGCFDPRAIPPGTSFGNYCSIAPHIRIFRANHPRDRFTSHPLLFNPNAGVVKEDLLDRPRLEIGHDVWIGEWSIILPRVRRIGNGSMIGAGSVVTRDVEPYSIVAGNPAREIGKRFDARVIDALERSAWWNLDRDRLAARADELDELRARSGAGSPG